MTAAHAPTPALPAPLPQANKDIHTTIPQHSRRCAPNGTPLSLFFPFTHKQDFRKQNVRFLQKNLTVSEIVPTFAEETHPQRMTNKNRHTLNQIREVARLSTPKGSQVLLFGSRARGEARKGSDWDILIVLPKNRLEQTDFDTITYPLVELGWKIGEQINPILYSQDEWEANSISPFYENVMKDGINLI